jgi:hypothetical protein
MGRHAVADLAWAQQKAPFSTEHAHFVQRMQRVDGSWDEPEEIIGWNPPPG